MRDINPDDPKLNRTSAGNGDDESWAFVPVIVGVAALCLLLFFFLTPAFEDEGNGARSARPGAATSATRP